MRNVVFRYSGHEVSKYSGYHFRKLLCGPEVTSPNNFFKVPDASSQLVN